MPRANVRSTTVHGKHGTHTRSAHTRATRGAKPTMFTLQPGRAVRNAGKAFMAWKHRRKAVALGLAALAVGEVAGFTVFKVSGGILIGTGLVLSLLGAGLLTRSGS